MIARGAMRSFTLVVCCVFSAANGALGRAQVRGSSGHEGRRRLPKHNPFVQDHADSAPEAKGREHADPKNPLEHMTLDFDPVMFELQPGNGDYDPNYIDLLRQSDFNGMPPDLYMQEHEQLQEEIESGVYSTARKGKGSGSKGGSAKSSGAYKADYEYYPGPGKGKGDSKSGSKGYYDDDYYLDDCDEEEEYEDDYYHESESEDSYDEEHDYDDDYYHDDEMSYPGKGKGKGHGGRSGKGHGKGSSGDYEGKGKGDSGDYEGKGKGKGGVGSSSRSKSSGKGGKGKGGSNSSKSGKGCRSRSPHQVPGHSPAPAESSDDGGARPPVAVMPPTPAQTPAPDGSPTVVMPPTTAAPVFSPPSMFTASPTDAGSVAVPLDVYAISYEIVPPTQPRQGTRFELDEVADLTRLYLEEFFFAEFGTGSTMTFLDDFVTRLLTHTFIMGEPLIVNYDSVARFNPFSSSVPITPQLNALLVIAFAGSNLAEYQNRLATRLSDGNIFKDTVPALVDSTTRVSRGPSSEGPNGATIAAAAVAATLVAASLIIYRRRSREEEMVGKDLNDKPGDITLAGETFAGDTYDGTASVGASSLEYANRQRYDEEAGGKEAFNLGTINESDDSSVRPLFGGGQMRDTDESDESEDENEDDDEGSNESRENGGSVASGDNSSRADLDLSKMPSFEEVALQEPSHVPSQNSYFGGTYQPSEDSPSDDNTSHSSDSDVSRFTQSQDRAETEHNEAQSLLSFDTVEEIGPPRRVGSDSLVERPPKKSERQDGKRRPRTVAEIEALLSTDIDDDESIMTTLSALEDSSLGPTSSRPRTVSQIESLLSGGSK